MLKYGNLRNHLKRKKNQRVILRDECYYWKYQNSASLGDRSSKILSSFHNLDEYPFFLTISDLLKVNPPSGRNENTLNKIIYLRCCQEFGGILIVSSIPKLGNTETQWK